ncbi:uncharacterized protein [Nicotiana tomentosiformis]|uniref:uncharacterized protein n=1 Tax=Nicotiana tomentosiformis TaxID=4098 RepID=UPI00388CA8B8
MPAYAKFMKEILTKKRKIEENSTVKLTEHCSSINFDKSLCDSGASINLMPLSIYKKPEKDIGEIRFYSSEYGGEQGGPFHILGIPFLAAGRAILDIHERKLMHRVGEETVTFEMNVETGVKKKKPATSVEWKVKG